MAGPTSTIPKKLLNMLEYAVNQEKEADLMIRYTKVFTRELVFAVDIMTFVMEDSNLYFENFIYPNCLGRPCPSDFDDVMKKFVEITLKKYKSVAINLIEKNVNLDQPTYAEFKSFTNAAALKMENLEYGSYAYLVFCVTMAQMCSIAYLHGIVKAPDFGIMLMCRTYSNFLMKSALPPNPWEEIKTAAREAVELLKIETRREVIRTIE